MSELHVGLPSTGYDIRIEPGLLASLPNLLKQWLPAGEAAVIVSDSNVWGYYGSALLTSAITVGLNVKPHILPAGEQNKSLAGLADLYDFFLEQTLNRHRTVIALGGGVIGDLVGFAAATYMRGIAYLQVPTTLLAQVDASVGGKTAIDLPQGKNLVGAFYQPSWVLIDPTVLLTLPEREWKSGLAEVIKYGAIQDADLFERLHQSLDDAALTEVIRRCCQIKARIVEQDEREHGQRMLLNFGHTFGHAIELAGAYAGLNHGEAVAVGMVIAARIGESLGLTAAGTVQALRELLTQQRIDYQSPYPLTSLLPLVAADKKNLSGGLQMVLLRQIGEAFTQQLTLNELADVVVQLAAEND
ncbi:MAG: 3-dehydroquinate synthase [Actinomycetia bacterium]|nr:3-dehydroquinate synthase [Actinomycetes bacterium]